MSKLQWENIPWTIGDLLRALALIVIGIFVMAQVLFCLADLNLLAVDAVSLLFITALLQAVLMVAAVLLIAFGLRRAAWRDLGLGSPLLRHWLLGILGGVAMVTMAFAFGWLLGRYTSDLPTQPMVEYVLAYSTPRDILLIGFVVVVLAPLSEELVFRGFIYGGLRKRVGKLLALLLTSLAFAVVHFQFHWAMFSQIMLLGIILALIYEKTRSLIVPILAHSLYNLFSVAALLLLSGG